MLAATFELEKFLPPIEKSFEFLTFLLELIPT
jgi:hypothetical protein